MDLSPWYDRNPKLKVVETNRKFYKQFSHKLVFGIDYAMHVSGTNKDPAQLIGRLRHRLRVTESRLMSEIDRLRPFFDWYIQRDKTKFGCRIEGTSVSIFANDLDSLYQLASTQFNNYQLVMLSTVFDNQTQQLLDQGYIIVKQPTDYPYKITLREGFYKSVQDRNSLGQYLRSLGNEIKITQNILRTLESSNKYIYHSYFYVKDIRMVDMVNLVSPGIIRSVQVVVTK
jgi:hypothetical protein